MKTQNLYIDNNAGNNFLNSDSDGFNAMAERLIVQMTGNKAKASELVNSHQNELFNMLLMGDRPMDARDFLLSK